MSYNSVRNHTHDVGMYDYRPNWTPLSPITIINWYNIWIWPSLKAELTFFFPHVSRAQHLTLASTRTRVIQLRAQCTDHWTTGQSCDVGIPTVQLTMHVKSSTLYGCTVVRAYGHTVVQLYCHTSKIFQLDGFLLFCIIMGLSYAFGNVSVEQGCHGSIFFLHEKLVIRYRLEWDQT